MYMWYLRVFFFLSLTYFSSPNILKIHPRYCKWQKILLSHGWIIFLCTYVYQYSSADQSFLTLWDPMDYSTPGLPLHHWLPEFTQTHVHWVGDAIQPLHPLLSPSPPTFKLPQHQGLFKSASSSHQEAKVLEFNISPSNEYSGLISFRRDWLDLLAVQGTLKSPLQHHSSKASILWCSTFFIVQLSHPYMATGKTIALSRWNFVDKVMSLLLSMLSKLVITSLQGTSIF